MLYIAANNTKRAAFKSSPLRVCVPGMAHRLGGESPLQARQGKLLAKRQVAAAAKRGLKEAKGKTLPRRTETAQEANSPGEEANLFKAQYLIERLFPVSCCLSGK